jgi:hypothetical protein
MTCTVGGNGLPPAAGDVKLTGTYNSVPPIVTSGEFELYKVTFPGGVRTETLVDMNSFMFNPPRGGSGSDVNAFNDVTKYPTGTTVCGTYELRDANNSALFGSPVKSSDFTVP